LSSCGLGPPARAKTVLQIGIHRQLGRRGNIATIGNHLAAHHDTVGAAEHVGEPEAGGGERFEAERRQQFRGTGIPGVGNDESARALVQRAE
jgi:hypothetical protein